MEGLESHTLSHSSKTIHYLTAGPNDGPLLIFVHGWPGIAETWKPQLLTFAALGFHVVAADTEGYGKSSNSRNLRDYSTESLIADQLALLKQLKRKEAIWVAHDWGCGILWSLAAHHPEVCTGVVNLCVPYRMLELGLEELLTSVNRDIYTVKDYPNGQWDYQAFYEKQGDDATAFFDANVSNTVKLLFSKGNPAGYGQPARSSTLLKDGGWFGGAKSAPDVPLEATCLDKPMFDALVESLSRNGFWGATAYYLNHKVNRAYNLNPVNNGVLTMPVLFIEAKWDHVCATSQSTTSEPMRKHCRNLTEVSIEAGHWVALEKPREVNAALARWLVTNLPTHWPGFWKTPMVASTQQGNL